MCPVDSVEYTPQKYACVWPWSIVTKVGWDPNTPKVMIDNRDDRHNQLLVKLSKSTSDYVTDFRWKAGVGGLKLVVGWMGNPLWWTIFLNKRTSDTFIYTAHTTSPFWAIITPEYYGLILSAAGIAGSVNSDCIWKSRNASMCNIKFWVIRAVQKEGLLGGFQL